MGTLRRRAAARRTAAALVALGLVSAACSSNPEAAPSTTEPPSSVEVSADSDLTFDVADNVGLVIEPGDFASAGNVAAKPAGVEGPKGPSILLAAEPISLEVTGEVAAPLTLRFDGSDAPDDAVAALFRYSDSEGWYSIAVAGSDGVAVAERTSFSPISWGWITGAAEDVASGARDLLGDRHDPPACSTGPPAWFSVDPPGVDVVHVCGTTNVESGTGAERGEVQIINNRGVVLEVQVPAGVAYAFVANQPEPIRAAVRTFTGRDSVLLAPGGLMTVGYSQPTVGSYTPVRVDYSEAAALATVLIESVGFTGAYGAVYQALASCNIAPKPLDARREIEGFGDVVGIATACFTNLIADPEAVVALATESVAATHGISAAVAAGDRTFADQIDKAAGQLKTAARALTVLTAGSKIIDAVADLYVNADVGDFNSLSPGITLRPAEPEPSAMPGGDSSAACGDVGLEANTDHGYFNITAEGVQCQEVEALLRGSVSPTGDGTATVGRFDCRRTAVDDDGFYSERWECEDGTASFRFDYS